MGDVGETFQVFNEIKREQRAKIEPNRFEYAMNQFKKLDLSFVRAGDAIFIGTKTGQIDFWPYTGWFCGRKPLGKIKGRGIKNLLKQIGSIQ